MCDAVFNKYTLRKYDYSGLGAAELAAKEIWNLSHNGRSLGSIERVSKFGYTVNWLHKGPSWPLGIKRRSLRSAFEAARAVYDAKLDAHRTDMADRGVGLCVSTSASEPIGFINGGDWR